MAGVYDVLYKESPYRLGVYKPSERQSWYDMSEIEQMRTLRGKQQQLAELPQPERRKKLKEAAQPLRNTLQIIGGVLNIPSALISGAFKQLVDNVPGYDVNEYFRDVFKFKEQVSWRDVIGLLAEKDEDENMWDKKWSQIVFGLTLDIALDPLTYFGGFGIKAFKGAKGAVALDDLIKRAGKLAADKGANALQINRVMNNVRRSATRRWGFRAPWKLTKEATEKQIGKMPEALQKYLKVSEKVSPAQLGSVVDVTGFAKKTFKEMGDKRAWFQVVDDALANWMPGYRGLRKALNPKAEAIQDVFQDKMILANMTNEKKVHLSNTLRKLFKGLDEEQGTLLREFMEESRYVDEGMAGFLAHKAELVTQFVKKYETTDKGFYKVFDELVEHNKEYQTVFKRTTRDFLKHSVKKKMTPRQIVKEVDFYYDKAALIRMQTVLDDAGIKHGDLLSLANPRLYGAEKTAKQWFGEAYPEWLKRLDDDQLAFLDSKMDIARKLYDDQLLLERQYDITTQMRRNYIYGATGRRMSTKEGTELGTSFPSFLEHKTGISYAEKIKDLEQSMIRQGFAKNTKQAQKYLKEGRYIEDFGRVYYTIQEQLYARLSSGMKAIHRKMFLDDSVKQWGKYVGEKIPIPTHLRVDGVPELAGYVFDADTAKFIGRAHEIFSTNVELSKFVRSFDKVMNWWKVLVTSVNPGFHIRNAYGSGFNGIVKWGWEYMNPKYWKQAKQMVGFANKYTPDMARIIGVDDLSSTAKWLDDEIIKGVTYKQAIKEFKETGVIGKKFKATEIIRDEPVKYAGNAKKLAKTLNIAGKESFLAKAGDKIGSDTESFVRTVGALIELKRTGNLRQSAFTAQEVFVNYQNLTQFEKMVGRRVFPFWSWMKQNTANQIKFVFTQPGRYSKIARVGQALEAGAKNKLSEQLRPEYFNRLGMWQLPIELPDGTPLFFNPDFPFKDLGNLNPVNWRTNILTGLSPFLKLPMELVPKGGYDIFRGRPMERYPGYKAPVPGILQDVVKILPKGVRKTLGIEKDKDGKYRMNPKTAHAITNLLPFVRNTSRLLMRETAVMDADKYFQWASYTLGIKIKPVSPLTQQYYATRDAIRKRKRELVEQGISY